MIPLLILLAFAQPNESPMLAAAKSRQERLKNLRVRWVVKETVSAGGASKGNGKSFPIQETKLESAGKVTFAGSRVRYEHTLVAWRPNIRFEKYIEWIVRENSMTTNFHPEGFGDGMPRATIMERAIPIQDPLMLPLTQFARGLDPAFCVFPLGGLKPAGRTLAIDGVECEEFVGDGEASYWIDPNAGFAIRRMVFDRTSGQMELNITHDPDGQAIRSWTMTEHWPKGELRRTWEVQIKDWTLPVSIPDDEFKLTFPPGTLVHDNRNGKQFRVEEDGAMVDVNAPPVEPEVPPRRLPLQVAVAVGIVLAIALAGRIVRSFAMRRRPT
jgi:hypothetical protein